MIEATRDGPVVCMVDRLDLAVGDDGEILRSLLLSLAQRITDELPIVLISTVEGPSELGAMEATQSDLLYVARRLSSRHLADWISIPRLTESDIAEWVGACDPSVTRVLVEVAGYRPRSLSAAFDYWRAKGLVELDAEERWILVPTVKDRARHFDTIISERLPSVLGTEDLQTLDRARTILSYASLEGHEFTARAIADALEQDRDEVIDFLDARLVAAADGGEGLVSDIGFTSGVAEGHSIKAARYRFESEFVRLAFDRALGVAERAEAAYRVAIQLAQLYSTDRWRAHTLAQLFEEAGDEVSARHFQNIHDFDAATERLLRRADLLMGLDSSSFDRWERIRLREEVRPTALAMLNHGPPQRALSLFEQLHRLAAEPDIGSLETEVPALSGCAQCLLVLGRFDEARHAAEGAIAGARELEHDGLLANSLFALGLTYFAQGDEPAAESALQESVELTPSAPALAQLAELVRARGAVAQARERLQEAHEITAERDRREHVHILLEQARLERFHGDRSKGQALALQSLNLAEQLDALPEEGFTRYELGLLAFEMGDHAQADDYLKRAGRIANEINSKLLAAAVLVDRARISAVAGGDVEHARSVIAQARETLAQQPKTSVDYLHYPRIRAETDRTIHDLEASLDRACGRAKDRSSDELGGTE
jgi:tetratricopeptide (TPR) repeat protein